MSDLFTPPRLFRNVTFHRHTDRAVGWLELFYDLVYIATLIQIGNFLSDNVSLHGFAQFLVLMAVVWWSWTGETFYQNRYFVDDLMHRVLVFIQMFAIASLGLSVSGAFGELYVQFTLAFVVTRLMLILMYWRAARFHPESRALSGGFMTGFSIGIGIWLGSLLLPAEFHWVGWIAAILFELTIPLWPNIREAQLKWGTDLHHISERFGIFTIIVLGESFVKVLDDAQGSTIGAPELIFSTFGLTVLYALWWLYFSDTAGKVIDFVNSGKAFAWIYGHLPLAVSLVAFGVAAKKAFGATLDHPNEAINPDYRLLYTASIVLYLVSLALIDWGLNDEMTARSQRQEAVVHVIAALVVGIVGVLATGITPIGLVMFIAVVMVAQVVYSIIVERSTAEAEPEAAHAPGD